MVLRLCIVTSKEGTAGLVSRLAEATCDDAGAGEYLGLDGGDGGGNGGSFGIVAGSPAAPAGSVLGEP